MDTQPMERLVARLGTGDRQALDSLFAVVYAELHRMATAVLSGESPTSRTRPTALVNQLYLELQRQGTIQAADQEHFFCIAAYLMRQILVGQARHRSRAKRGGAALTIPWDDQAEQELLYFPPSDQLLAVDEALSRLEAIDPLKARIVELRFFADLSIDATALALDIAPATVKRHWSVARLWLYRELSGQVEP